MISSTADGEKQALDLLMKYPETEGITGLQPGTKPQQEQGFTEGRRPSAQQQAAGCRLDAREGASSDPSSSTADRRKHAARVRRRCVCTPAGQQGQERGRVERDATGLQDLHGNEDLCSAEREVSVGGGRHTRVV